MEPIQEMPIIESLLEDIKHTSNRLDSLADKLDSKLNGNQQINDPAKVGGAGFGIIEKLQDIKTSLSNTEKSLEEQVNKM